MSHAVLDLEPDSGHGGSKAPEKGVLICGLVQQWGATKYIKTWWFKHVQNQAFIQMARIRVESRFVDKVIDSVIDLSQPAICLASLVTPTISRLSS